ASHRRAVGDASVRRGKARRRPRGAASGARAGGWRGYACHRRSRRARHPRRIHGPDWSCGRIRKGCAVRSTGGSHDHIGFSLAQYVTCLNGIVWREALRFLHQRERFVSALVRPLVWLFIFAVGFRQVLGVSIVPPYETYILYEVYIAPGLMAM